jgi:type II secretory pathway pseudopilin PulG
MQRKNHILKQRSGFAMIMAIALLVVISTIMAVSISMSTTTTARTTNEYLHEQAMLLASSATEYAILAISGHNRIANDNCINEINAVYPNADNPMFDIKITMGYVGLNAGAGCSQYIATIATPETNGTVIMDVTVTSNAALNLTEPIRYERRTLQKL